MTSLVMSICVCGRINVCVRSTKVITKTLSCWLCLEKSENWSNLTKVSLSLTEEIKSVRLTLPHISFVTAKTSKKICSFFQSITDFASFSSGYYQPFLSLGMGNGPHQLPEVFIYCVSVKSSA